MTALKRKDGSWNAGKITLVCTLLLTAATCVIALPVALDYCHKAAAPWTTLPEKIDAMKRDLDEIKRRLPDTDYAATTNHFKMTRRD